MHVSASEEYGLRCAARLAQAYLDPARNTLSAPEIAEMEGLSVEYVSKFMLHLKKAGLVTAVRGVNGGFALTREPVQISLKDVLDSLGGRRKSGEEFCDSFAGKSESCVRMESCSIRPMWQILSTYIDEFTRELTLQDLLQTESETLKKSEAIARKNVEQLRVMREAREGQETQEKHGARESQEARLQTPANAASSSTDKTAAPEKSSAPGKTETRTS